MSQSSVRNHHQIEPFEHTCMRNPSRSASPEVQGEGPTSTGLDEVEDDLLSLSDCSHPDELIIDA